MWEMKVNQSRRKFTERRPANQGRYVTCNMKRGYPPYLHLSSRSACSSRRGAPQATAGAIHGKYICNPISIIQKNKGQTSENHVYTKLDVRRQAIRRIHIWLVHCITCNCIHSRAWDRLDACVHRPRPPSSSCPSVPVTATL